MYQILFSDGDLSMDLDDNGIVTIEIGEADYSGYLDHGIDMTDIHGRSVSMTVDEWNDFVDEVHHNIANGIMDDYGMVASRREGSVSFEVYDPTKKENKYNLPLHVSFVHDLSTQDRNYFFQGTGEDANRVPMEEFFKKIDVQ